MKQRYYSLQKLLATDSEYNMLLGERSNGKSYSVKEHCIREAWNDNRLFIYLRRWQVDVKTSSVEAYFADAPITSITNGKCNCITVYAGKIFASYYDENKDETKKLKQIGFVMYLTGETHFKSMAFPDYWNIIFEEFITDSGYLEEEPRKLMSLISTIARRRKIKVFMVGNTISRFCPYFREWTLVNVPKQKQGQIDIYNLENNTIKVAVEMCESTTGGLNSMFIGSAKNMINGGAWDSKTYPHLPRPLSSYDDLYRLLFIFDGFQYKAHVLKDKETGFVLLFVHPFTGRLKDKDRIICDYFSESPLITDSLIEVLYGDNIVRQCIRSNKIVFSDNLTGQEFNAIIKEKL